MIKNWMIGKDVILTLAATTGGRGTVVVLCTELGEIQTKLLLHFVNDESVMKDL